MQIKIHESEAARQKAFCLRRRAEQIGKNIFGAGLIRYYLLEGFDPSTNGALPWLSLEGFYDSLGAPDSFTFKDFVKALEQLNFIRLNRAGKAPLIRLVCKEPKC